jgi:glycosyltransferase involved in cell wall biosynthesis
MSKKISVTYYQRKARKYNNFSIENYFNAVRLGLPQNIIPKISISRYESNGIFKRFYNSIEAIYRQSEVNHITGDVHYLAYFLNPKKTLLSVMDCGQLNVLTGIKFKLFRFFWYQLPAAKSSYITTISTATKNDLLKYIKFDENKVKVIPVCISNNFKKVDKYFNKLKPRVLQVGVTPNKNLERLIAALENIPCVLVIIGQVPHHIKSLSQEKNVELELFDKPLTMEEVVEQYNEADIITLISTLEGFGMPIVEGNTVGRVVITGNLASMPEVAANAAHLVDPFSIQDMKSGFIKIINDDEYRNKLIEKGYENCERFSNKKIAEQFTELYKAIADKPLRDI